MEGLTKERGNKREREERICKWEGRVRTELSHNLDVNPNMKKEGKKKEENKADLKEKYGREVEFI